MRDTGKAFGVPGTKHIKGGESFYPQKRSTWKRDIGPHLVEVERLADIASRGESGLLLSEIRSMAKDQRNYLVAVARKQLDL